MFDKPFIDAGDIAPALGWSRPWFRRKLKSLIDDHAFPSPLPGGRWHADTVANWIRSYGDQATATRQTGRILPATHGATANLIQAFGRAA